MVLRNILKMKLFLGNFKKIFFNRLMLKHRHGIGYFIINYLQLNNYNAQKVLDI